MDISSKLESIVQLYQQSSNVQVTYLPQQPVYIMGDKSQINRLFTNLLKNAIEAVGEEEVSKIHITQIVENNQIIILIQDNGKGIPSSIKECIFQPNFTTKTSGTGLGLAISRGIVEKHHGEISFITIENEGTTFKIVLPIIKH
jgi:signal transduction histidine kinase